MTFPETLIAPTRGDPRPGEPGRLGNPAAAQPEPVHSPSHTHTRTHTHAAGPVRLMSTHRLWGSECPPSSPWPGHIWDYETLRKSHHLLLPPPSGISAAPRAPSPPPSS
ncbi:hypothetical protein H696_05300 [Fonticula alba]|uniref:Uncharacterized protein n=1 Tax=Fonticula alba TaxID=691883 RepID=A0A058Z381_FONAL|nr:hypothetical protein H696_05300 [Fonticula alba]KCV68383.1 hypothetical protein H696_05300 [Fonticula alba]|eukprot:XP_009497437.1 hypothetical protein H696_05300 [Fonticula alba]